MYGVPQLVAFLPGDPLLAEHDLVEKFIAANFSDLLLDAEGLANLFRGTELPLDDPAEEVTVILVAGVDGRGPIAELRGLDGPSLFEIRQVLEGLPRIRVPVFGLLGQHLHDDLRVPGR